MDEPRFRPYLCQIERVNNEISRLNKRLKELKEIRKLNEVNLLRTMRSMNFQRIKGYSILSLERKYPDFSVHHNDISRRKRSLEERREAAVHLFREMGVPDPEKLIKEYRETQKIYVPEQP